MILNAMVALLAVLIPVMWSSKAKGYGLFSAFLAMVCTIAAGAVALAFWEPLAYILLNVGKDGSSFVGALLQDTAWGLALLIPFLVALVVLRLGVDTLVKANVDMGETANFAGGIVFGAVSGVVTLGIIVISAGFFRLPPDFMGYEAIQEKGGSPVYASSLWVPVDKLTTGLYERLSLGSFATSTPLAVRRPALYEQAAMQRLSYRGKSRVSILPDQFQVLGRYSMAGPLDTLLSDSFLLDPSGKPGRKQSVLYPDGEAPREGATLEGYVISFNSGAKEKGGNVVVTPGQMRLICKTGDSTAVGVHPFAVVAPPEAGGAKGLYRFRFDAPEGFIASVGGGSEAVFAFEFLVPPGATAQELLIKNTSISTGEGSSLKSRAFGGPTERDKAVRDKTILSDFGAHVPGAGAALDTSGTKIVSPGGKTSRVEDIETGPNLPEGMTLNKTNRGSLDISDNNEIADGDSTFSKEAFAERGLVKELRVDKFQAGKSTGIVKVTLAKAGARSLYGRSVETAEQVLQPLLVDSTGERYEPIGFIYNDGETIRIRFTPGQPIRALADAPALSRTKRDQTLILIYRPTKGATITSFALGSKEVAQFSPGVKVE